MEGHSSMPPVVRWKATTVGPIEMCIGNDILKFIPVRSIYLFGLLLLGGE
jgi:hypothetical protein